MSVLKQGFYFIIITTEVLCCCFCCCCFLLFFGLWVILFLGVTPEFKALLKEVKASQHHAFSTGTHGNLRTQFRCFFGFCVYFQREPLPSDLDTMCGYAQFLSRSLLAKTVPNYLSGVKMLHILLGFDYPFSGNIILKLVLKGINRLNPHIPNRAPPITPELLMDLFYVLDYQNSLEVTVYACGLFLFFTMARLGSILPGSGKTPHNLYLIYDRVNFCDFGLVVSLLQTKTIQFGERILHLRTCHVV